MAKQSSAKLSSLAGKVLNGYQPTRDEIEAMAASVLSQDERRGQRKAKTRRAGGTRLIEMIEAAMHPAAITSRTGGHASVTLGFSNGRSIEIERQRVRGMTEAELTAYVESLTR